MAIGLDPDAFSPTFSASDHFGHIWLSLQEGDGVRSALKSEKAFTAATVNENDVPEAG